MTSVLRRRTLAAAVSIFVLLVVIVQLVPFYVALTTSLKAKSDLSPQWVFPLQNLHWGNFVAAVEQAGILRAMGNSVVVTSLSTILVCVLGAFAAYPLARRRTPLNRALGAINIGLMMVPALSLLVPLYSLLAQINALNTYWGEILVMVTNSLPLSIFLYSAFLRTVPAAVEEAAIVDGANPLQLMRHIVMPILRPVTVTVGIITGVNVWNEYALSGYIMSSRQMQTVPPAIASFFSMQGGNLGAATAASLLSLIPVVAAFLFLQRYFVQGIVGAEQ